MGNNRNCINVGQKLIIKFDFDEEMNPASSVFECSIKLELENQGNPSLNTGFRSLWFKYVDWDVFSRRIKEHQRNIKYSLVDIYEIFGLSVFEDEASIQLFISIKNQSYKNEQFLLEYSVGVSTEEFRILSDFFENFEKWW